MCIIVATIAFYFQYHLDYCSLHPSSPYQEQEAEYKFYRRSKLMHFQELGSLAHLLNHLFLFPDPRSKSFNCHYYTCSAHLTLQESFVPQPFIGCFLAFVWGLWRLLLCQRDPSVSPQALPSWLTLCSWVHFSQPSSDPTTFPYPRVAWIIRSLYGTDQLSFAPDL